MASDSVDSRLGAFTWYFTPGAQAAVAIENAPLAWSAETVTARVVQGGGMTTAIVTPNVTVDDDGTTTTVTVLLSVADTTRLGRSLRRFELLVDGEPVLFATTEGLWSGNSGDTTQTVTVTTNVSSAVSSVAGRTGAITLTAADVPGVATTANLAALPDLGANSFTGQQSVVTTGTAILTAGALDAANAAGDFYKVGQGVSFAAGVNGTRGDSIASDTACGTGASFFYGNYVNFTGANAHDTKGSVQGHAVFGEVAANASYGEAAGYVTTLTNARDGALVEGFEAVVTDNHGGGRMVGAGIIAKANAAITRWFRGLWLTSQGSQPAGDAVYVDGASGWSNFFIGKNSADATTFSVSSTGIVHAAASVHAPGFYREADPVRFVVWVDGSPEGVVSASAGALCLRTDGGIGATAYVKETGTGNTGWTPQGADRVLASAQFLPSGDITYSTTSSTAVVINASCSITFTVPASGTVRFLFNCHARSANVATNNTMCIRDGSGLVAGTARRMLAVTTLTRVTYLARVTGLTPGASLTWWPSYFSSDGVNGVEVRAGDGANNHGPILMEVEGR
jgi:hypothetical protein